MKTRTTDYGPRPTPHAPRREHSQRGVALVITLILLSLITFMAITFLVVSRSERGSVTTQTDLTTARLAADAARDHAIAELLAPVMATTNPFNYGLLVSTNYIKLAGFDTGLAGDVLNVNYDYTTKGLPLNPNEQCQNIQNLWLNPRPPVFIVTNANSPNGISNDFRFYVDMNRNGAFDPTGLLPLTNAQNQQIVGSSAFLVGDPQWIGILQHADLFHSSTNLFSSRYAYLVVPTGQALDINSIHNDAKGLSLDLRYLNDGFLRNQGALTAEINLAAFLSDLNTNLWPNANQLSSQYGFAPYNYQTDTNLSSSGVASQDAGSVVRYRYATNLNALASVSSLFGAAGASAFSTDFLDGYSGGPLMANTWWPVGLADADRLRVTRPWAGADNPNHFYTTQDLFDRNRFPVDASSRFPPYSFVDRLKWAGTNIDSYNRYTFSRLLSQLGTDSAPELDNKMNLNYRNVDDNGYVVPNAVTNFIPWQPTQFFTNAAIRLLADAGYTVAPPNPNGTAMINSTSNILVASYTSTGVLITNLHIPIWPTNYYTPSVHRLLQLAANIYDATTNRDDHVIPLYPYLPSVFQPVFQDASSGRGSGGQISITGYQEVTNTYLATTLTPPHDLSDPQDRAVKPFEMVYGIPLVIGAKKGLPNFNELALHTAAQVVRKLQFRRPNGSADQAVNQTNQMFIVGISNVLGVEAWNSYSNNYPRGLRIYVWPDITVLLTNETGRVLNPAPQRYRPSATQLYVPASAWRAYSSDAEQYSFQVPLSTNLVFLTNSTYSRASQRFVPLTPMFEQVSPAFYVPHWVLSVKTRLRFAVVDIVANRIVDYVNLSDSVMASLTDVLASDGACGNSYTPSGSKGSMWCTNHWPSLANENQPTYGVMNQIEVSLGDPRIGNQADWNSAVSEFPPGMDRKAAIDFFRYQFDLGAIYYPSRTYYKTNTFGAPYQPFRNVNLVTSWSANDPLVHYTASDLTDLLSTNQTVSLDKLTTPPTANIGLVNARYEPWGGNPAQRSASTTKYDRTVKDPVPKAHAAADDWDFPANKFPNVGWLGRVHRGTPWQTVYLKSEPVSTNTPLNWVKWTGNTQIATNYGQISTNRLPLYRITNGLAADAYFTQPTNDWHFLDLFTSALDANATRGKLSINQTNLAAWSAVLSGVIALTNNPYVPGNLAPLVIQPAGLYDPATPATWPPLVRILNGMNTTRTNFPGGVFHRLGDLLAVPQLTVASPFLNTTIDPASPTYTLSDAAYERIPQQILGLLKAESVPRFVIYSFGQTLKPAPRSRVTGGTFFGLCTNYQITAEVATRAVVRFDGIQPYQYGTNSPIGNLHPVIESFNVLPPD